MFSEWIKAQTGFDKHKALEQGKCATCLGDKGMFKDTLSEKDYNITALCQKCQDKLYED